MDKTEYYHPMRLSLDRMRESIKSDLPSVAYQHSMKLKEKNDELNKILENEIASKYDKNKISPIENLHEQLNFAIILATEKHRGQKDRGGKPYILHPLEVMSGCESIEEKIVALLHDLIEDTDITEEFLRHFFNKEVVDAIVLLTRNDDIDYMDYIRNIKGNTLATKVKLQDLKHNMDLTRLSNTPSSNDIERQEKYKKALSILNE